LRDLGELRFKRGVQPDDPVRGESSTKGDASRIVACPTSEATRLRITVLKHGADMLTDADRVTQSYCLKHLDAGYLRRQARTEGMRYVRR
jgi:hypothetical protein